MKMPQFKSKKEEIAWLMANKAAIIDLKKSATKLADPFGVPATTEPGVTKAAAAADGDTDTAIKRTIVGNTYLWLDSHGDVHLPGLFGKSLKERTPWHLHDHVFQIMAKVGTPQSVVEKYIDWKALGVNKAGQTQALVMESLIEKELNPQIFKSYRSGEIDQHSVGMRYVKLMLAANDEDYKEAFAIWNTYIDQIGNKDVAKDKGYFWAVQEAKLIEISCVLEGSNTLTPTLESEKSTAIEPPPGTREQPRKSLFGSIGSKINN